jgi:hypothetical protein
LYDAKETVVMQQAPKKESNMAAAWAFPLFGAVAMLSFAAAFVAVRTYRAKRSTRQFQMVQPVALDEESLLSEDDSMLE